MKPLAKLCPVPLLAALSLPLPAATVDLAPVGGGAAQSPSVLGDARDPAGLAPPSFARETDPQALMELADDVGGDDSGAALRQRGAEPEEAVAAPTPVPLPPALWLFVSTLGLMVLMARRRE